MWRAMHLQFIRSFVAVCFTGCLASVVYGQPGRGPAPVVVAPVTLETVTSTQTFVGTIQPSQRAIVGSAVDGRVVECDIEEGDRIEEGHALAQLLTATITLELETAKSELAFKQAQLDELENGTRPEQIEQARARMAGANARREYLVDRRERLRDLANNTNAVTEDEWREAVASAIQAEQASAEAKAAYDEAKAGPRKEVIAQAKAQVDMQRAVVKKLADQLGKHTIRSRFSGYVVRKHSEIGQWVNRGDPVAEVVGVDVVEVVIQVLEQSVPYVVPGAEVAVEIPALPQSPFAGKVLAAVPQGDVRARTFPVKVAIENQTTESGPLIKPGMYARVELPVGATKEALLVPKDAVVLDKRSPMVYVVEGADAAGQKGVVSPVPIELGAAHGVKIEVNGDLKPHQLVVVEGNERLRPGAEVAIDRLTGEKAQPSSAQ